jgi:hypothetical protein
MSDSDEAADGQALAYDEAIRLAKLNPDHELLQYALHPGDDAIWEEFIARFGKPGISREVQKAYPAMAWLYAQYWIALREACDELDPTVVKNPAVVPFTPAGNYSPIDDDIPF